jgi:large subunit ribosomal protein L29
MAILHPAEMRDMTTAEREVELEELETELLNLKALQAAGGVPENPSELKELRRTIARLKTVRNEEGDLDGEDASDDE